MLTSMPQERLVGNKHVVSVGRDHAYAKGRDDKQIQPAFAADPNQLSWNIQYLSERGTQLDYNQAGQGYFKQLNTPEEMSTLLEQVVQDPNNPFLRRVIDKVANTMSLSQGQGPANKRRKGGYPTAVPNNTNPPNVDDEPLDQTVFQAPYYPKPEQARREFVRPMPNEQAYEMGEDTYRQIDRGSGWVYNMDNNSGRAVKHTGMQTPRLNEETQYVELRSQTPTVHLQKTYPYTPQYY